MINLFYQLYLSRDNVFDEIRKFKNIFFSNLFVFIKEIN